MSRKKVKARDKVTLKNARDGAIERNLTSGEDTRISKRTVDYDLRGDAERDSFSPIGKSQSSKHKHKQRRPHAAENGAAAAKAEPQTVFETNDAPKQPETAAVTPIRTLDAGEAVQDDIARPVNHHSVAKTVLTNGKSKPPKQSRQRFVPVEDSASDTQEPAPRPALKQEEPASRHDRHESPLKTDQPSELKFARDEPAPSKGKRQAGKPRYGNRQQPDATNVNTDSGGVADDKADGVSEPPTPPPGADASSEVAATTTTAPLPPKGADKPPKDGETSLKTDKSSKLKFSEGEAEPTPPSRSEVKQQKRYGKAQKQADRAVTKLDKAKSKLPAKKKLRAKTVLDGETGNAKRKLYFESEVKSQAEHLKGAKPLRPVKAVGNSVLMFAHTKIYQAERENVAVEAAHKGEILIEGGVRTALRHHKTAPYQRVQKLERKARKKTINAAYQKALADNPSLKSNPLSRAMQKRKIKKDYAKAAREAKKTAERAKKAGGAVGNAAKAVAGVIKRHPVAAATVALTILLLFCLMSLIGAFGGAGSGGLSGLLSASYLAEDADIDNAELVYTEWETDLQIQAGGVESSYPGYDEYRCNVGEISHNPYELLAYLTAKYQGFSYTAIETDLQALFNEQYSLSFTPTTETRYADPNDANEDGDYEPYDWRVMTVTLTARSFDSVIASNLSAEEAEHYAILMQTKGARQYLANPFGDLNWLPYVTSNYGYRIHPISGEKNYHKGVDIGLPPGTPIQSGQDGVVTFAGYSDDYGNVVVIENADGLVSKYAHCDTLSVAVGQTVKAGDVIGTVGSTGNSIGAHLHLEILKNGQYLNGVLFADTGSYTAAPNYGYAGLPMGDGSYAALIAEAERHLGKSYVFGASGPSAFDCSGLICYVYRNAGVYDFGRIGATSIYNACNPVSVEEARPGDVVTFHSTYSAANPVTHIGIYVGYVNGRPMMLHSGSPCQYTYIDTPYWQQHFYGFARIPE